MSRAIEKVTVFVTREAANGTELALFEHPYAGIQLPAGTVEVAEALEAAALREAMEETGLSELTLARYLGREEERLPDEQRVVCRSSTLYARPDRISFDWVQLPRGATVRRHRQEGGFTQVSYEEFDHTLNPSYVTFHVKGWVPDEVLADQRTRHFFHLTFEGQTEDEWLVSIDNHHFRLFWAPLNTTPPLTPPQDRWLAWLLT